MSGAKPLQRRVGVFDVPVFWCCLAMASQPAERDPATDADSSSHTHSRSPRANAIIVVEDSHQKFVATPGCPACAVNQDLCDRIHELQKQNQILRRRLRASEELVNEWVKVVAESPSQR